MYSSSAMGDFRVGLSGGAVAEVDDSADPLGLDELGKPDISSCSSVITSPFEVISLFLMIRLWGKSPRDVWTCCLTLEFLLTQLCKNHSQEI